MAADIDLDFDDEDDPLQPASGGQVISAAGHAVPVLNAAEKVFYEKLRDNYARAYIFEDPSDIADLDKILTYELISFRLTQQLGLGHDANHIPLTTRDIVSINKTLKETGQLLAGAKDALGVSKAARDKAEGEDTASYLQNLLKRAKEFGVHRNNQSVEAIAWLMEVCSVAGTYLRSNDLERAKTNYRTADDIVEWIWNEVFPKVNELDAHFREHQQKIWIETL